MCELLIGGCFEGLNEQHIARFIGEQRVQADRACAARDLKADVQLGPLAGLAAEGGGSAFDLLEEIGLRPGQSEVERLRRAFKALPVLVPSEDDAAVGAPHLVDGIAVKEATIEWRNAGL